MDEGDLSEQIARLEARIEKHSGTMENCRKLILASKVAMAGGAILLLAITLGIIFDPVAIVAAIAAIIGGVVVFGSNTSTLMQTRGDLAAAEEKRSELISMLHLRLVDDVSGHPTIH